MRASVKRWADNTIIWTGDKHTNKSDRRRYLPEIIVDHIVEGSANNCISWFTSESNNVSSAHFLVSKLGKVYQFVKIEDNAWGNGLPNERIPKAAAVIVKSRPGINPNWYSVSIEHEGIFAETKGELTTPQLQATIMLHAYIIDYVKDHFNITIPVDRGHILGHFEIDPVRKPNCPGGLFPFNTIIQKLGGISVDNNLPFEDIAGHWAKEDIIRANKLGLVKGIGDTDKDGRQEFAPNRPMTRAEGTKMILNLYDICK